MLPQESEPASELVLHWDDEYLVGIPHLDDQHKTLLRLCAIAAAAVAHKDNSEIIAALLADLASFADAHFHDEEELMAKYGYPGLGAHKDEHNRLHERFTALLLDESTDTNLDLRVLQLTQDWVKIHLRVCDRKYAEYIKLMRGGAEGRTAPGS